VARTCRSERCSQVKRVSIADEEGLISRSGPEVNRGRPFGGKKAGADNL
jgi:hypothetical protein